MLALSSRSTTFMGLGDKLDMLVVPGPLLDDEVLGGVASGQQILTGTNGTGEGGIVMVRVFSWGGRCRGMAGGGITSLSHTLATTVAAACSLPFRQLWAWSARSVCFCRLSF